MQENEQNIIRDCIQKVARSKARKYAKKQQKHSSIQSRECAKKELGEKVRKKEAKNRKNYTRKDVIKKQDTM